MPDGEGGLKRKWMEMPDSTFAVLTFGELKVGDKFIALPSPGDNHGHGGFRKAHYLFVKTEPVRSFGDRNSNSKRLMDGACSSDPDCMYVIKVD